MYTLLQQPKVVLLKIAEADDLYGEKERKKTKSDCSVPVAQNKIAFIVFIHREFVFNMYPKWLHDKSRSNILWIGLKYQ